MPKRIGIGVIRSLGLFETRCDEGLFQNDRKEGYMQYGFVLEGGDVHTIVELTQEAEAAGWDGVFIADAISIETKEFPAFPWFDPWIVLAAMAARTERIRI